MLFRRFGKHIRDHDWFAVAVDFVILVVGVFIGLQVTDWSQSRADRASEAAAIERLVAEYERNLDLLAVDKDKSQKVMAASVQLLAMIAPEPDPAIDDATVQPLFTDCLVNPVFTPALGATNSLLASGDLGLIDDTEIQRRLSQWEATAQVLIEWQEIERHHGEELIVGLTFEYVAWPTLDAAFEGRPGRGRLTSDFAGLFSSKRFQGLLYNRWYNMRAAIRRIEALETETAELIRLLQSRRDAL